MKLSRYRVVVTGRRRGVKSEEELPRGARRRGRAHRGAQAVLPLWMRVLIAAQEGLAERTLGPHALERVQLTNGELRHLRAYARASLLPAAGSDAMDFIRGGSRVAITRAPEAGEVLRHLLLEPIDLTSDQGRAVQRARKRLGLVSALDAEVLPAFIERFGASLLRDSLVIYNGHATTAVTSLFPALEALGLRDAAFRLAAYSGEAGVASLFNTLLARTSQRSDDAHDLGASGDARAALLSALAERKENPIILVNAGPLLASGELPPRVRERIAAGEIRFVQHNATDIAAMRSLGVEAVIIDAAGSDTKALEAQVIGEQYTVLAAMAALQYLSAGLYQSTLIVKGAGLIGGAVVRAALTLGLPAERLVVIDRDPAVLAHVRALGVERAHEAEPPGLREEPHGVLVVATSECGLDGRDIAAYPKETLVMSATSGGLGVDMESLRQSFLDAYAANFTLPVAAYRVNAASPSHDVVLGPHGGKRRQLVRVLNCRRDPATDVLRACPPNLATPLYQDRLVTTAMITAAVAQARTTSTPGVHALDPGAQAEIRGAFERLGLGTPRAPTVRGIDPKFAREAYAAIAPPPPEA